MRALPVDDDLVPADGWIRSPMMRRSVDLPQPDGPISETNSPAWMSSVMSSSAVTPVRNDFERPSIETTMFGWSVM